MSENSVPRPFDSFELAVAILMGIAAVGTALAGYQSSLWGGQSQDAYGEAATLSAKASAEQSTAMIAIAHDLSVDMQCKRLLLEAIDTRDPVDQDRHFAIASHLYTHQINELAYEHLKLPAEYYMSPGREPIPDEALLAALDIDLGEDYLAANMAEAGRQFAAADTTLGKARTANDTGDRFGLVTVIFAVALFFAGICLVLKTRIRWVVMGLSAVVAFAAAVYFFVLPWAP